MTVKRLIALMVWLVSCGGDEPPAAVGEGCSDNLDCASELCVTTFDDARVVNGGLCTTACEFNDPDLACADGEICLRYNGTGEKYCYVQCSDDRQCRTGWSCPCLDLLCQMRACVPNG